MSLGHEPAVAGQASKDAIREFLEGHTHEIGAVDKLAERLAAHGEGAQEKLIESIESVSGRPDDRGLLVQAFGKLGGAAAAEKLRDYTTDKWPDPIRLNAMRAIAERAHPEARTILEGLQGDDDPQIANGAKECLKQLS
jgi:hypothetical protein